ncbi:hypothetical protein [Mesorhizobium sp. M0643]|uniref:hypothetical protein n=1 Tax=Mesorhizobium sp. M0643 TaxID=2956978 RepID=UPI00333DD164
MFGYEVDGLDYEIRGGLPYVAPGEIAPHVLEILALGLASTIEEGPTIIPGQSFLGLEDGEYVASVLTWSSGSDAIEQTKCAFRKSRTGVPLIPGQWWSAPPD